MKREIKDSFFRSIFKRKKYLKELYFDLSGVMLNTKDIKVMNLKNYVLDVLKNDVAFMTKDNTLIVIIEHQSTTNYNMDIRMLLYCGRLLEKYINERYTRGLHTTEKIEIPRTEFYVLYNASARMRESEEFKTKIKLRNGEIDIGTKMVDIRYAKLPRSVKHRKKALCSYSFIIDKYSDLTDNEIRKLGRKPTKEELDGISQRAFDEAIRLCQKENLYLNLFDEEEFKTDTMKRMTYEEGLELYHDIGVEVGLREGKIEGKIDVAKAMLAEGMSLERVSALTGLGIRKLEQLQS